MSSTAPIAPASTAKAALNPRYKAIYDAMKKQDYRAAVRAAERKEISNTPLARYVESAIHAM